MSEMQGVKSVPEVAEDDNNLESAVSVKGGEKAAEDQDKKQQHHNVQDTSSETMRALEDIGKSLDFQRETEDQSPKRGEVVGRSVGECRNILPVLVEHLRSALELSAGSSNRNIINEPLAPDPINRCCNPQQHQQHDTESKLLLPLRTMDFNFMEDVLISDIKHALVRLQETLRRIDVEALSRYSSTLQPNDRLNLLQLISNLVTNLKNAKLEDLPEPAQPVVTPATNSVGVKKKQHLRGRNRHTIGVSSEELARARKWLEERGTGITLTSQRLSLAPQTINLENSTPDIKEKVFENPRACDKHMKDAINQQQSLQSKSKDIEVSPLVTHESREPKTTTTMITTATPAAPAVVNGSVVGDKFTDPLVDVNESTAFMNKCNNKFTAKKTKIKRANTIDIPNYLKLQAQKNQSPIAGLKRPIDISDRLSWNTPQVPNIIPSFEPKTDNDRKFLALINRNNETSGVSSTSQPFRSFNYRQTSSIADKNWKSRFSNIKTAFDKQSPPGSITDESSRRSSRDDGRCFSREKDEVFAASLRLGRLPETTPSPQNHFVPKKLPIFNHAATSPFQKIQQPQQHHQQQHQHQKQIYEEKPILSCYLPVCASSGMLKAKLKMFDQEPIDTSSASSTPSRLQQSGRATVNVKPDKIIKDNNFNHWQVKTRNNNNNNNNNFYHDNNYDKMKRYTIFNDDDHIKINPSPIQKKQNVAVQTNNCPIQVSRVENDHNDSLMIRQQFCQPHHQQASTYQPSVPRTFYSENENPIYVPPKPMPRDFEFFVDAPMINDNEKKYWNRHSYNGDQHYHDDDTSDHSFLDENIANQDISDDKVITRYTSAVCTMEKSPSLSPIPQSQTFTPILSPLCHQNSVQSPPQSIALRDDIQRHNMLQQNLIRRLQQQNEHQEKCNSSIASPSQTSSSFVGQCDRESNQSSQVSPSFYPPERTNGRESIEPLIESHNTQEKINLFEGKTHPIIKKDQHHHQQLLEPLVLPRPQYNAAPPVPPKINVISPPRALPQGFSGPPTIPPMPRKYSTSPVDSSDEYLVSCATKPNRSIVLSKSESWHQLAMSKNHLQVPQPAHPPHKPPRVSSQSAKHNFESASASSSDAVKKMEKVQSYFVTDQKRESKSRRSFSPRKNQGGALARSHTMPHIFDDASEVDKAFDSLFEEAIRDNRH